MVQKVNIRKGEKIFRVHFSFNTDLVEIMQEHSGWWYRKEKCWQFPIWKFNSIYDELKSKLYRVEITKLIERPKPKENRTLDYYGNCL